MDMLHTLKNGGLEKYLCLYGDVNVNSYESLDSEYEAYHLSNSKSVQSQIYQNVQTYQQQNRILALRERWEGRLCGGKMS